MVMGGGPGVGREAVGGWEGLCGCEGRRAGRGEWLVEGGGRAGEGRAVKGAGWELERTGGWGWQQRRGTVGRVGREGREGGKEGGGWQGGEPKGWTWRRGVGQDDAPTGGEKKVGGRGGAGWVVEGREQGGRWVGRAGTEWSEEGWEVTGDWHLPSTCPQGKERRAV